MENDGAIGGGPDYLGVLRRQWPVVLGSLALGVVATLLLLSVLPKAYASSASVLVEATNSNSVSSDTRTVGVINMDTEAQIVKSLPVATAVKTATDSPLTAEQLSKQVTVNVPANTTILQIGFQDTSAASAQKVAEAFATSYIDFRTQQSADMIDNQAKKLNTQAQATVAAIDKLNQKIAQLPSGSASRAGAQQNLSQLQARLKWVDEQLQPLQAQPVAAGSVIVSAPLNEAPVKPSKILIGGSVVSLFLLLGIVLAWWRDGREGRIRRVSEIEEGLELTVLGVIDDIPASDVAGNRRSVQQYRQVVHAAVARLGSGNGALLVAGVGAYSTAEEVAATLSTELARTGNDVRLLYSDERAAEIFRPSLQGESSTRLTSSSLAVARATTEGDPHDRGLPEVLEHSAAKGRYEVLATPPTGLSADAQAIAPHATFTLLVITLDQSTREEVVEALRQLRQVGATHVGAVVIAQASRKERAQSRALAEGRQQWLTSRGSTDDEPRPPAPAAVVPDAETAEIVVEQYSPPEPASPEPVDDESHEPDEHTAVEDAVDEHVVVPEASIPAESGGRDLSPRRPGVGGSTRLGVKRPTNGRPSDQRQNGDLSRPVPVPVKRSK